MSRYDEHRLEQERIRRQADAEFAFARALEAKHVDCEEFMAAWGLSLHQFNVLAQFVHGVNDEDPTLPPMLAALLFAVESCNHASPAATVRARVTA